MQKEGRVQAHEEQHGRPLLLHPTEEPLFFLDYAIQPRFRNIILLLFGQSI